jgi:DNA-binding LacI/PurR family transcriptional regulator
MSRGAGTLSEVARHCAVSASTVSRVLNNSGKGRFSVSPKVRDRILSTARTLNYRPSIAARSLTVNKTMLVAVLGIGGIRSDRVGPVEEAVNALGEVLDKAGYEICIAMLSKWHGPFAPPPLRVDGVIAVGPQSLADLEALERSNIPYVSVNGVTGERGWSVSPDDARGTFLALKHLYSLGHRNIAYLDHCFVDACHPSVLERRKAYFDAAGELGFRVPFMNLPMLPAATAWDSYYEPFVRRTIVEQKMTAVLAYSHQGALGLIRAAHDLGLSVPRDFSLVCFNNEPVVRLSVPSITSIDVPSVRMGQLAAEILLRDLTAPEGRAASEPIRVRVEESLIVRESSAPPPGS